MRASRIIIFFYAAMIGVPLMLIARLVSDNLHYFALSYILTVLIALGLIIYSSIGFIEIYVHKTDPLHAMSLQKNYDDKVENIEVESYPEKAARMVDVKIRRFNNETKQMDEKSYSVSADKNSTVLDALLNVKSHQDQTLAMRYSCRMGICGSCAMVVNGKPSLTCECNLLKHANEGSVTVEPMQGHPLLHDLVTDFDDFFEKHKSVSPHIERETVEERYAAKEQIKQTNEQRNEYLPYSYCIMCGLCADACPVVNSNPNFIGPQALSQTYRYHKDSRDKKGAKRLFDVDSQDGAWGCEFTGTCSEVCPKGVDPASSIQLLKGEIFSNVLKDETKK
jgi:succinate dehydrogenase / fumarate reductase iron-sulfur subunit